MLVSRRRQQNVKKTKSVFKILEETVNERLIFVEWINFRITKVAGGRRHQGLPSGGEVKRHFLKRSVSPASAKHDFEETT